MCLKIEREAFGWFKRVKKVDFGSLGFPKRAGKPIGDGFGKSGKQGGDGLIKWDLRI